MPPRRLHPAPGGGGRPGDRRSPQRGGLRPRAGSGDRRSSRGPARNRAIRPCLRAPRRGARPCGGRPLRPALFACRSRPETRASRHPRLRERHPCDRLARARGARHRACRSVAGGRTTTTGRRRRSRRSRSRSGWRWRRPVLPKSPAPRVCCEQPGGGAYGGGEPRLDPRTLRSPGPACAHRRRPRRGGRRGPCRSSGGGCVRGRQWKH